jgi:hypothetical protein
MVSISDLHGLRTGIATHVGNAATDGKGARPWRGTASFDRHRRHLLGRKWHALGCAKSDYSTKSLTRRRLAGRGRRGGILSNDPRGHQPYFENSIGSSSHQIADVGWPGLAVSVLQFVCYKKKRLSTRPTMARAICHTSVGCHWLLNG